MNETTRTATFAGTAIALLALAGWTWNASQPPTETGESNLGKPLFEAFEAADVQPQSMEVYALDEDGARQEFVVRKKDGVWTIPSHNNYPAEAAERLGQVTSAMFGLVRQARDTDSPADHEKNGVLDPLDPEITDPAAAGKRIIIKGPGDVTLADLIVGKPAREIVANQADLAFGESGRTQLYYVRAKDESTVYRLPLQLDLSTRFSDWINTDLFDPGDALPLEIVVDNYEIVEEKDPLGQVYGLVKKQGDRLEFQREDPATPWQAGGLDPRTESVQQAAVNRLFFSADGLEIRGVRPKFTLQGEQLITADLQLNRDPKLVRDVDSFRSALGKLQRELSSRGFNLMPLDREQQEMGLVSEFGEVSIGLNDGLRYTLHFGKAVKGDEKSIEIGNDSAEITTAGETAEESAPEKAESGSGEESEKETSESNSGNGATEDGATGDDATEDDATEDDATADNRYVMIRVLLDESLLGPKPVAPVAPEEPVKPEGYLPKSESPESPPAVAQTGDAAENTDASSNPETADQQPGPEPARDPAFEAYDQAMAQYREELAQHELAKVRFADEEKEWQQRFEDAQKRVAEMNDRYGRWYYVVSGNNLQSMRAPRENLIEVTEPEPGLPPVPDIEFNDEVPENSGGGE